MEPAVGPLAGASEDVALACVLGQVQFGVDLLNMPTNGSGNYIDRDWLVGWMVVGPSLDGLKTGVRKGLVGAGGAEGPWIPWLLRLLVLPPPGGQGLDWGQGQDEGLEPVGYCRRSGMVGGQG